MRLRALLGLGILLAVAAPAGATASVPSSFFGVSAESPSSEDFQRMREGGLGSFRLAINWRTVQHNRKSSYDWRVIDAQIRAAAESGLKLSPVLFGTPHFLDRTPDQPKLIPPTVSARDLALWRAFVAAAAHRYGPEGTLWEEDPYAPSMPIRTWIVWNEENARGWWYPQVDPVAYAKLVKATDVAISSVDPDAEISLGGMYGYPHDRRSQDAVSFLKRFYRVPGIERHFELLNLHPYGPGVKTVKRQIKQARSVARKAGDGGVRMLIGEIGWASGGPKNDEFDVGDVIVGIRGQRNRIRAATEMLVDNRDRWNIVGTYVYVWRDFAQGSRCRWCAKSGLLTRAGEAKPAWDALRKIIRDNR